MIDLSSEIKEELWLRGELSWKLNPAQKIIYSFLRRLPRGVREAVALISRRWGKSFLGVIMALEDCIRNPGVQVITCGPDIKQTKRILSPILNKIISDAPKGLIRPSKAEDLWHVSESLWLICGFDTALESARGLDAYSLYIEETGSSNPLNYDYTMKSVLRPTTMLSKGRTHHLTTPPVEEDHPFVTETMPKTELEHALFIRTIEDNPMLSKEDIEAEIREAGGRTSPHCQRELFCKIVRDAQRIVIPEFNPELHAKHIETPRYCSFITSSDYGGKRDNHGILLGFFDFERKKVCIPDEVWLPVNTGTADIVASTYEMETRNNVVWQNGYPSRRTDAPGQTLVDLRKMGFICSAPDKGKDSVEEGIQALRVAFLKNEIEIDEDKCPVLAATLKYQMWDRNKKDLQRTVALGHGDMLAALVYLYRHIDKTTNPFPRHEGQSADTHYIVPEADYESDRELATIFDSDD